MACSNKFFHIFSTLSSTNFTCPFLNTLPKILREVHRVTAKKKKKKEKKSTLSKFKATFQIGIFIEIILMNAYESQTKRVAILTL